MKKLRVTVFFVGTGEELCLISLLIPFSIVLHAHTIFIILIKGLAKRGNVVAETLFPDRFPWVAKLGNIRFGSKICVREAKRFLT